MSFSPVSRQPVARLVSSVLAEAGVVFGGFVVLGMGLGVLIASLGLPWWIAPLISLLVLAGSAEFVVVGMLAAGAPLTAVATTTALINSRHLVYGISYPLEKIRGFWARLYAIYSLCDEAFALNVNQPESKLFRGRMLLIHAGLHLSWAAGSTLGAVLGAGFLSQLRGLDFVMTALFLALALDSFRQTPDRVTLCSALLSGLVGVVFTPGSILLTALALFLALSLVRYGLVKRRALHGR